MPRTASTTCCHGTSSRQAESSVIRSERLRTGLVLIYKRLEVSSFVWPKIQDGVMQLSRAQYEALFEGLDWRRMVPKQVTPPTATG
ncbi:MAG: IS66 family insertion sequence element accessory protein TnpB [Rhodobacteraceae bacterium]|nr:IS66 family insertion sequence element accessory protein TnpB [Paracoccaceae bacterium]